MMNDDVNVSDYLTPIDAAVLQKHRGRQASTFYTRLVEAFVATGQPAMKVDVARIGRKPVRVRSTLVKTRKAGGLQDKVRVSLIDSEVFLVLR
jgi:hypothetical protein